MSIEKEFDAFRSNGPRFQNPVAHSLHSASCAHAAWPAQSALRNEPKAALPNEPKPVLPNEPSLPNEPKLSLRNEPKLSLPNEPKLSLPNEPKPQPLSLPPAPALNARSATNPRPPAPGPRPPVPDPRPPAPGPRPPVFAPLFRNPHLQTIAAHYWPRPNHPTPLTRRLIQTEPGVQVLVESQTPADPQGHLLLVHGLEGSGQAGYIRSLSALALQHNFSTHRFHMRTCGGTEHLCSTLYHAGLTSDLLAVLRQLHSEGVPPVFVAGFSLGGNVVLKLAGELADSAPDLIRAVVAASTPLDLAACARRIAQPDNTFYERRFVRKMRQRLCATGRYSPRDFAGLRSVEAIDDRITAPSFGFGNAANYYATQSAIDFLPRIRVPALLIQAMDDTFVPFEIFRHEAVRANPCIELLATESGGHLGFLARGPHRFWLDRTIMEWILSRQVYR
jgi:uncharacterized protein